MDWTMIANVDDALGRIHTLGYFLIERYQKDSREAGEQMGAESGMNEVRDQTISDLRTEIAEPKFDVAYAWIQTDQIVRKFLSAFLEAFDQVRKNAELARRDHVEPNNEEAEAGDGDAVEAV